MTDLVSTASGDRIAYDRYGTGPSLVFVAGAGPSRATDPVTTRTAELAGEQGVEAVVYDRPGRGESPASGVLDLGRELDALAAIVDVAHGRPVLVGHSSGCAIALAAAARGFAVAGLVLWEAPLASDGARTAEWADDVSALLDAGDLEAAQVAYMRDMPPEWLEGARVSPAWPSIVARAPSLRADAEALKWATAGDPALTFAAVVEPVLAVVGESTLEVMVASSRVIADAIPQATQERMPGANHSWEPEPMAARLAAFVHAVAIA